MSRFSAVALLLAGLGCAHVRTADARDAVPGDGNKVTESRTLPAFSRVELATALDVEVTEGPAQSVAVTIDRNLQPLVETRVEGDKLVIDSRQNLRCRGVCRIAIAVPVLHAFAIGGSGNVRIAGADASRDVSLAVDGSGNLTWTGRAGQLQVAIQGSGDIRLSGSADGLTADISGSGDVNAEELRARTARLAISGSGDIQARLDGGPLAAAIDGSGDIVWSGNAQVESAAVSGTGSIRRR